VQGVKNNKQEAHKLAEQAAQWTEDLARAVEHIKTDNAALERLRPDVAPIRECAPHSLCPLNAADSCSVLDAIVKAMELQKQQSFRKRLMDGSKNKEALADLRAQLKEVYERFMVCHFLNACTSLTSQCSYLLRSARKLHFRSFSLTLTLVRFTYPNISKIRSF
jgi:hypothetical protein